MECLYRILFNRIKIVGNVMGWMLIGKNSFGLEIFIIGDQELVCLDGEYEKEGVV